MIVVPKINGNELLINISKDTDAIGGLVTANSGLYSIDGEVRLGKNPLIEDVRIQTYDHSFALVGNNIGIEHGIVQWVQQNDGGQIQLSDSQSGSLVHDVNSGIIGDSVFVLPFITNAHFHFYHHNYGGGGLKIKVGDEYSAIEGLMDGDGKLHNGTSLYTTQNGAYIHLMGCMSKSGSNWAIVSTRGTWSLNS